MDASLDRGLPSLNNFVREGRRMIFRSVLAAKRFTLDQIVDAYRYMEPKELSGKIIVRKLLTGHSQRTFHGNILNEQNEHFIR